MRIKKGQKIETRLKVKKGYKDVIYWSPELNSVPLCINHGVRELDCVLSLFKINIIVFILLCCYVG